MVSVRSRLMPRVKKARARPRPVITVIVQCLQEKRLSSKKLTNAQQIAIRGLVPEEPTVNDQSWQT